MTTDHQDELGKTPGSVSSEDSGENRPPPTLTDSRESKRGVLVGALIGALGTVFAAVLGTIVATDWFPQLIGIRSDSIHVERLVLYARILYFKDRSAGESPVITKKVGLKNSTLSRKVNPIFDEGLYMLSYQLLPHNVDILDHQVHTSGIVEATPIVPPTAVFDSDSYEEKDGKVLSYTINIKDKEYVLSAWHLYNAFQKNAQGKYESDGGIHIKYHTDEAVVIFDFSALDYATQISSPPVIWTKTEHDEQRELHPSAFNNGILVSLIKNPEIGTKIICDWAWAIE